jgi:hypothetical protein
MGAKVAPLLAIEPNDFAEQEIGTSLNLIIEIGAMLTALPSCILAAKHLHLFPVFVSVPSSKNSRGVSSEPVYSGPSSFLQICGLQHLSIEVSNFFASE